MVYQVVVNVEHCRESGVQTSVWRFFFQRQQLPRALSVLVYSIGDPASPYHIVRDSGVVMVYLVVVNLE